MVLEKEAKWIIRHDDFEGEVTTSCESACLGGIAGLVFYAQVDTIDGSTKVEYLVRTHHLENLTGREEMTWEEISWTDLYSQHPAAANRQNN